jgi:hypothetical protein
LAQRKTQNPKLKHLELLTCPCYCWPPLLFAGLPWTSFPRQACIPQRRRRHRRIGRLLPPPPRQGPYLGPRLLRRRRCCCQGPFAACVAHSFAPALCSQEAGHQKVLLLPPSPPPRPRLLLVAHSHAGHPSRRDRVHVGVHVGLERRTTQRSTRWWRIYAILIAVVALEVVSELALLVERESALNEVAFSP